MGYYIRTYTHLYVCNIYIYIAFAVKYINITRLSPHQGILKRTSSIYRIINHLMILVLNCAVGLWKASYFPMISKNANAKCEWLSMKVPQSSSQIVMSPIRKQGNKIVLYLPSHFLIICNRFLIYVPDIRQITKLFTLFYVKLFAITLFVRYRGAHLIGQKGFVCRARFKYLEAQGHKMRGPSDPQLFCK